MEPRIAARYAKALFEAAQKQKIVGSVGDDLNTIANLLRGDARLTKFITDPESTRVQKEELFDKVFSDRVTSLTMHLVRLVLEKRREAGLVDIRDAYDILRKESEKILSIKVTSARNLDDKERKGIEDKITKATGLKTDATYEVDPRVMGGVKVELEGYVMDGTVAGGLNRMRETLKGDLLNKN